MGDWKIFVDKIKELLKSKDLIAAKEELAIGLEKFPNQLNLLIIATDVYRALGDREKSLEYSELLINHHPDRWQGYGCAAQDLSALKRFNEAHERIRAGLEKIPNQINLLNIAIEVHRASGDRQMSLENSIILLTKDPNTSDNYFRNREDLVIMRDLEIPLKKIKKTLQIYPNHHNLLIAASDLNRMLGRRKESLEFAKMLIKNHPKSWHGYAIAGQEYAIDTQYEKANSVLKVGLQKTGMHMNLISILCDIAKASNETDEYIKFEYLLSERSKVDYLRELNLKPEDIKPKLKTEYAYPLKDRGSIDKSKSPHLYILVGLSGSGKSTFLESVRLDIDTIFSTKPIDVKIPKRAQIETLEKYNTCRFGGIRNHERAMLHSTHFSFTGIPRIGKEEKLPRQTLMHIDLSNLLFSDFCGKMLGVTKLSKKIHTKHVIKKHLFRVFSHDTFRRFESISFAIMDTNYATLKARNELKCKKYWITIQLYEQIMISLHEFVVCAGFKCNYVIEKDGVYLIRQTRYADMHI